MLDKKLDLHFVFVNIIINNTIVKCRKYCNNFIFIFYNKFKIMFKSKNKNTLFIYRNTV